MHYFDLQHTLMAKHAQHIVLVHFPIALMVIAWVFDLLAWRTRNEGLANAARNNLIVAAVIALPVAITGIVAWRWQLEGAALKGALRLHLIAGVTACAMIWIALAVRVRGRSQTLCVMVETIAVFVVAVTAHLGGIVAGVVS